MAAVPDHLEAALADSHNWTSRLWTPTAGIIDSEIHADPSIGLDGYPVLSRQGPRVPPISLIRQPLAHRVQGVPSIRQRAEAASTRRQM